MSGEMTVSERREAMELACTRLEALMAGKEDARPTTNLTAADRDRIDPKTAYRLKIRSGAEDLKDLINVPISIIAFVAKLSDEKEGDNGETYRHVTIRILCDDGMILHTSSKGIAESLGAIMEDRGLGVWSPPVRVITRIRSIGGDPPKQWMYFDLEDQTHA